MIYSLFLAVWLKNVYVICSFLTYFIGKNSKDRKNWQIFPLTSLFHPSRLFDTLEYSLWEKNTYLWKYFSLELSRVDLIKQSNLTWVLYDILPWSDAFVFLNSSMSYLE